MDEWTRQNVVEPIERKLKTQEWINEFRNAMGDLDEWRPLRDCPLYGRIPTTYIFDCRAKNMKHCNINGTLCRRN